MESFPESVQPNCIYLIGPRASGKTCIGQLLGQKINWPCVDTDAALQAQCGQSVAELVSAHGWPGFRTRESDVLHACYAPRTVFATGGGMVLAAGNCAFMRQHGLVIYLSAPAEILVQRLEARPVPGQRPVLLPEQSLEAEVRILLAERQPLYLACAHVTVDANQPTAKVVSAVLQALGQAHCQGAERAFTAIKKVCRV